MPDQIDQLIKSLSTAQRQWFHRNVIRIGNPIAYVPTIWPVSIKRTWDALRSRGLIEGGPYGDQLTPLGLIVRNRIRSDTPHTSGARVK